MREKGITLIALVITIIVMLILAAVSITMAVNEGLFGYAQNAAQETENARDEEIEYGHVADNLEYEGLITKYAIVYGDINLDGRVTATDFGQIKAYLLGKIQLDKKALANADVNEDGVVDRVDAYLIKWKSNGSVDLPYFGEPFWTEEELQEFFPL